MRLIPLLAAFALFTSAAQAFETKATHAWVYDMTTNTVLLDKEGTVSVPPASMSKLMTIEMLFEALQEGRVQMDTTFGVSAKAMSFTAMGGSTMYLQETDRPTVEELIKGMVVNSGNDACTVVAEGLEGSEEEFARKMTERAQALGLTASTFANSSGWPDPGQRMSMKDLGLLAVHLITAYPELYPVFSETEYNYKDRAPANANNRNPILGVVSGADGLKTGHTQEAGYGMVGSVLQGERRIVFAFNGLTSEKERAEEAERIANWAFRQFALKTVVKAGTEVTQADVFLGAAPKVGLAAAEDLQLLIPAGAGKEIAAEVIYTGPLEAPVAKGTKVAQLVIRRPELPDQTVDLLTTADVAPAGFVDRMFVALTQLRSQYGI
ncbi:D-alanyl-D-alanine carboxypeptidase [Rhodobacter sp. KR11]|jgi:D-alanyl-D-alanine carboxypeptidase (penicillin-binding protein 5/6)|uniref:D-alanyl-D-alanine carboxypeptidase family protein n=1 Tax=Rhodobacter sp. KR11 TaxID=2974588 RepID=UPI00222272AF|nr:D-alanyl-D-alanine carboxypeptidase family protein [Rhodobacter sp. KR11]MCW1919359.1 D-alanyl-D-alanine carboxypeptidase [Rhodobacter sp. KR11]